MLNRRSSLGRGVSDGFLEFMKNDPVLKDVTMQKGMFPAQGIIVGQTVRRAGFSSLLWY